GAQPFECVVGPAGNRLEARGVVRALPCARVACKRLLHERPRALLLAPAQEGERDVEVLPGGGGERLTRRGADGEDDRSRLGGGRLAQRAGPCVDERADGCVERLVAQREGGAAAQDDVELLVAVH